MNEGWLKTKVSGKHIDLDAYVIMPNHFHGILIIERGDTMRCVPKVNRHFLLTMGKMHPAST